MKPARYVCTWAQDATPIAAEFWSALLGYSAHRRAELIVVAGQYLNPTSRHDEQFPDGEWAHETHPYLLDERRELCPNLVLHADVRTQPTASRPLSGFEVFCAGHSGIFGHPKRALEVIPTSTRMPRLLMTTGACTVANYSTTKAGRKGEAHHVLGALIVEVDAKGRYYCRHITWDRRTQSFTDLDTRYSATGHAAAPQAESLTLGDIHVGSKSPDGRAEAGARKLFDAVRPKHLVLHDVFDGQSCNHHEQSLRAKVGRLGATVEAEVEATCAALTDFSTWGDGKHATHVIRSNHDCFLERWVEECRPKEDAQNAAYWHWLSYQLLTHGQDVLAAEFHRLQPGEDVHFLSGDEPLMLGRVEHSFHGHRGTAGSRGSAAGFSRLGSKVTIGHSHTPCIRDGVYQTGVYGWLAPPYTIGSPTTWLNAHVVLHADGKRQLIIIVDGDFRK